MNYPLREISCKIVYYGPGLCGKTTNLKYVHAHADRATRGNLFTLDTAAERLHYFDYLPLDLGAVWGFKVRMQLYTVPGQLLYNATRRLILGGVDGLVFVADAQRVRFDANVLSLDNLRDNLSAQGDSLQEVPHVFQYNKRDLPDVAALEDLRAALNLHGAADFEASARDGSGVFEPLKAIARKVVTKLLRTGACPKIDVPPPESASVPIKSWPAAAFRRGALGGRPARPIAPLSAR
nr:GTPase domain-containing protein [Chondromyces crocatus]